MNSFKNVRELLLLSYVNNVVSDREFVLLYDAYQSKNPDFNYQQYDPFNLDNIDSAECKAEFHIEKADLPRLAEALQLPPTFHCQQRTVFDSMEGLCMFLKRVCYPCRYSVHRSTGNFLPGGGGAVNHLPKKIAQVAQIFAKESKRNEGHIAKT